MKTTAAPAFRTVAERLNKIRMGLDWLAPIADLAVRLWVANAFWRSGLVKIQSWDSTVALFTYEYQVPFLPPEVAAYLAAFTELLFPVLLAQDDHSHTPEPYSDSRVPLVAVKGWLRGARPWLRV